MNTQATTAPQTIIYSNGSGKPAGIETLKHNLSNHALCPLFIHSLTETPYQEQHNGAAKFFGNFAEYSAVFRLSTTDPVLIAELTELIEANPTVKAWRAAEAPNGGHSEAVKWWKDDLSINEQKAHLKAALLPNWFPENYGPAQFRLRIAEMYAAHLAAA